MSEDKNSPTPFFTPLRKWDKSIIILLGIILLNIWKFFSIPSILRRLTDVEDKQVGFLIFDSWIIILLSIFYIILNEAKTVSVLSLCFSYYVLFDVIGGTLRDIIGATIKHSDDDGRPVLRIGNPSRWLIASFLNVFLVILSFAILFLYYGNQFDPIIEDSISSIYMSAMTLTTLGYGDIKPLCADAKRIVLAELFFFLFLLTIKIPIAASVIKTESRYKYPK